MRRTRYNGTFALVALLNIALNFEYTIPAWILLALHFWLGISLWWFVGALGVFFLYIFIWMLALRLLNRIGRSAPPIPQPENRNPYSSKGYVPYAEQQKREGAGKRNENGRRREKSGECEMENGE